MGTDHFDLSTAQDFLQFRVYRIERRPGTPSDSSTVLTQVAKGSVEGALDTILVSY